MSELTNAERRALEPFGVVIAGICAAMEDRTDEELRAIIEATQKLSQTNCWWAVYRAAPLARFAAEHELASRAQRAKELESDA